MYHLDSFLLGTIKKNIVELLPMHVNKALVISAHSINVGMQIANYNSKVWRRIYV